MRLAYSVIAPKYFRRNETGSVAGRLRFARQFEQIMAIDHAAVAEANEGFEWGADTIEAEIRERVRGMIEAIVEEELESALRTSCVRR